jgi:hypothetical protein
MQTEPVYTIGLIITSVEAAVVALLTVGVLVAGLDQDTPVAVAIIGAGSAVTLAIGNVVGYRMTRARVTPWNGDAE